MRVGPHMRACVRVCTCVRVSARACVCGGYGADTFRSKCVKCHHPARKITQIPIPVQEPFVMRADEQGHSVQQKVTYSAHYAAVVSIRSDPVTRGW